MTDNSSPTDDETPRQTLKRMGKEKVRMLLQNGGLAQYLVNPAHDFLTETEEQTMRLDRTEEKPA